jgi:hypothetical protein
VPPPPPPVATKIELKGAKTASQLATEQNRFSHTPQVDVVHERIHQLHANWKYRQLVMEVVRYQMQDEAVLDAYDGVILKNCKPTAENIVQSGPVTHNAVRKNRVAFIQKQSAVSPNNNDVVDNESITVDGSIYDPNNIAKYQYAESNVGLAAYNTVNDTLISSDGAQRPHLVNYSSGNAADQFKFGYQNFPNPSPNLASVNPKIHLEANDKLNDDSNGLHRNASRENFGFVDMMSRFRGDYFPFDSNATGVCMNAKGENDGSSRCFHDLFMGNMTAEEIRKITYKTPLKRIVKVNHTFLLYVFFVYFLLYVPLVITEFC